MKKRRIGALIGVLVRFLRKASIVSRLRSIHVSENQSVGFKFERTRLKASQITYRSSLMPFRRDAGRRGTQIFAGISQKLQTDSESECSARENRPASPAEQGRRVLRESGTDAIRLRGKASLERRMRNNALGPE